MTTPQFVSLLIVAAAALLVLRAVTRPGQRRTTVWEWQRGLLFRHGRFVRELPPGEYASGWFGRAVVAVSLQPRLLVLPAQEVLSADGFSLKLGAVLQWQVTDARRHHGAMSGDGAGSQALHVAVQLALRSVAGGRTLDQLLAARADAGALEAEMLPQVSAAAALVGATAQRVALRDLVLPAEVRRMITEVERARREGLAALERARGEQAALRSLANAARLLRGNPELQTLRTLQALSPGPGRSAPTLVLGMPPVVPVAAAPPPDGASDAET